ncbi:hypothetical protein GCM10010319_35140 [Streptomyces blastmyceticus]|uniref:Secreted protein n=1 Tax=Streptomyces blastmyceticus TaxID=68180 RepID=A0ABP3GYI5_9ACTN
MSTVMLMGSTGAAEAGWARPSRATTDARAADRLSRPNVVLRMARDTRQNPRVLAAPTEQDRPTPPTGM